ncbi:MAG: bifunctional phosphopantothenoylcysteine decarboxylase/phosphopantothenate--cysteine ligase CoaBC [Gammaproteobacteria bacterium]
MKKLLLGVTGGIAAYKSADLVRRLQEVGYEVRVIMTLAATRLISPVTFQALSGQPVLYDWQQSESDFAMDHIAWARWADLVLIAPATADFIAKLTHGMADDVLSTTCLATDAPLWVAPAMNQQMWAHPATVENCAKLQQRGVQFLGPASGSQACGDEGFGRMMEPAEIIQHLQTARCEPDWQGIRVVITAGPTQEPIDPVRFISNHSSGKMGYALAQAAQQRGAEVVLISGPTALACPKQVQRICVTTAHQMHEAVMQQISDCNVFIAAAAVADYHCVEVAHQKLKKTGEMQLQLAPNPDILYEVAHRKTPPFTVGFAAETENLAQHAQQKLQYKKVNMIVANDVSNPQAGFYQDQNAVTVYTENSVREFSLRPKQQLAEELLTLILSIHSAHSKGSLNLN